MKLLMKVAPYWKALVAFVTPGIVGYVAAVQHASPGHENVTQGEWTSIIAAMVLTSLGVYGAKNGAVPHVPKRKRSAAGAIDALYLAGFVLVVPAILFLLGVLR